MTHQTQSLEKYRKLFPATLNGWISKLQLAVFVSLIFKKTQRFSSAHRSTQIP